TVDVKEATGKREGVDFRRVDDLHGERNCQIGIARYVLGHAVNVFVHHGVTDDLGRMVDLRGVLLADTNFLLLRDNALMRHLAAADFVHVLFISAEGERSERQDKGNQQRTGRGFLHWFAPSADTSIISDDVEQLWVSPENAASPAQSIRRDDP